MNTDKHAPDSLKYQWHLYGLVVRSDWATSLDKSIAYEIVDNYYSKFGNSRTSLSFLQKATGATRPSIIASTRRLVENGPFSVERQGKGTRPTEYKLLFDLAAKKPSGIADDTTSIDSPSGIACDTTASIADDTTTASSSIACDTQTDLQEPAYKAELRVGRNIDTHDALPLAGLAPAQAGTRDPEEKKMPFDRFWQSFPRKYQKPKARAAWNKLNPSQELAERIIKAAGLWAAHYEANPVEKRWMPSPANWLVGERYDEDLPDVYEDPKERAIVKAKDRPAKDKPYAHSVVKNGINEMYIVGVREEGTYMSDVHRVTLDLEYTETGETLTHELLIQDINGPASGQPGWIALNKAVDWKFNIAEIKGLPVKVANMSAGTIGFSKSFLPPKEEIVEVAIVGASASPVEPESEEECLEIKMMTDDDVAIEWFAMLKSNDKEEQVEDQRRIACLLKAVGVTGVDDERELIGKRMTIVKQGKGVKEFVPYPDIVKQAA
ncbi:hypothetical protein [Phyllobacterium sp. YR531]|uniref:hypothetical protein n=1 Tax=Phyllobacterium sp. YR531 TaxID=1144343 RepID=UPI00026F5B62|nr:hypothetical protein [Phyllobacterium sp. YR531]EJN04486.1 hypothetical protein PMI41_02127 [Phyllobacterium sp. YR531]